MNDNISIAEKEILINLFSQPSGINIYEFHEKYLLSPAQLSAFVDTYSKEGYVSINDDILSITPSGQRWIISKRAKLFLNEDKYWKKVPDSISFVSDSTLTNYNNFHLSPRAESELLNWYRNKIEEAGISAVR